jgi:hypothetical protein
MGPLHPLYEDRKQQLADHQYPYSDDPFVNQPIVIHSTYKSGQDIEALKHNILTAHYLGLLPTRKLFESIQEQGTLDRIHNHAATYAQKIIDEHARTLKTLEQLEQFEDSWKTLYRQTMSDYIAAVFAMVDTPLPHPEEVTVL